MDRSLLVIISSFAISLLITPLIIIYSVKKGLFVIPGKRMIHKRVTPSLGGIGIFLAFLIASQFFTRSIVSSDSTSILLFATLIFTLGIVDDLLQLSSLKKLLGQLLILLSFISLTGIRLNSLHEIMGIGELPYSVSFGATLILMIIVINSLNLIDGIDGLAGIIGMISSFSFAFWFYITGSTDYSILLFALFGGIAGFIIFNWEPSKIFMGDTGSLVIGTILSIAAIKFINSNLELHGENYGFKAPITTAVCFLSVPLIDTARIIILRLYKKQSPLRPDKNHIHHTLLKLGLSHSQTALLLGFIQAVYVAIAVLLRGVEDIILLPGIIIFSTTLCVFLDRKILKRLTIKEVD